ARRAPARAAAARRRADREVARELRERRVRPRSLDVERELVLHATRLVASLSDHLRDELREIGAAVRAAAREERDRAAVLVDPAVDEVLLDALRRRVAPRAPLGAVALELDPRRISDRRRSAHLQPGRAFIDVPPRIHRELERELHVATARAREELAA